MWNKSNSNIPNNYELFEIEFVNHPVHLPYHQYRENMLKYLYRISFLVLLIFPLVSTGQAIVVGETSLQSKIISKKVIGVKSPDNDTGPLSKNSYPKNIVGLKMGADDPWFGISYERILHQNIGSEVQIGLIGASLGAKLYFPAIRSGRVNFHVGILPGWGFADGLKTYFPIGINVLTKNNFRISLDAGPRIWHGNGEENFLGFSLKIGKGF